MTKTIKQLTVGDAFFIAEPGSTKYTQVIVKEVYSESLIFNTSDKVQRYEKDSVEFKNGYMEYKRIAFTDESKAIRYCKAQLMKELNSTIKKAKIAIKEVTEFKLKHFELLNHDWTEKQINILEDQENSL